MPSPQNPARIVQEESEQLGKYLEELPSDSLAKPSGCDDWQVADVISHISRVAASYAATIAKGVHGDISPLDGLPEAGSVDPALISEGVAQRAISYRQALGR